MDAVWPVKTKHHEVWNSRIRIEASVRTIDQTGVEMEALTAVSVAALTVYDMCKSFDREMTVSSIQLFEKSGGKSGTYKRDSDWNSNFLKSQIIPNSREMKKNSEKKI